MSPSTFKISIESIEDALRNFGLWQMRGVKSLINDGVSDEFKKASIKDSYFKAYEAGLANYDFDFLLKDQSFFQFEFCFEKKGEFEARYSFFQNPIEFITYEEYVLREIQNSGIEASIEDFGNGFEAEYHQFLNEQEAISNFSTFRYDVDYPNYHPIVHSISHLHIGHLNNTRIPINKIISPLRFVLFVIKHVYYHQWKTKVESNQEFIIEQLKKSQIGCQDLENKDWIEIEQMELFII